MSYFTSGLHYLFVFLMIPVEEWHNSGTTHDKNEKWMFPSDCKRYPDYEANAKFRKIENNRIAYLSDIRTDRGTCIISYMIDENLFIVYNSSEKLGGPGGSMS